MKSIYIGFNYFQKQLKVFIVNGTAVLTLVSLLHSFTMAAEDGPSKRDFSLCQIALLSRNPLTADPIQYSETIQEQLNQHAVMLMTWHSTSPKVGLVVEKMRKLITSTYKLASIADLHNIKVAQEETVKGSIFSMVFAGKKNSFVKFLNDIASHEFSKNFKSERLRHIELLSDHTFQEQVTNRDRTALETPGFTAFLGTNLQKWYTIIANLIKNTTTSQHHIINAYGGNGIGHTLVKIGSADFEKLREISAPGLLRTIELKLNDLQTSGTWTLDQLVALLNQSINRATPLKITNAEGQYIYLISTDAFGYLQQSRSPILELQPTELMPSRDSEQNASEINGAWQRVSRYIRSHFLNNAEFNPICTTTPTACLENNAPMQQQNAPSSETTTHPFTATEASEQPFTATEAPTQHAVAPTVEPVVEIIGSHPTSPVGEPSQGRLFSEISLPTTNTETDAPRVFEGIAEFPAETNTLIPAIADPTEGETTPLSVETANVANSTAELVTSPAETKNTQTLSPQSDQNDSPETTITKSNTGTDRLSSTNTSTNGNITLRQLRILMGSNNKTETEEFMVYFSIILIEKLKEDRILTDQQDHETLQIIDLISKKSNLKDMLTKQFSADDFETIEINLLTYGLEKQKYTYLQLLSAILSENRNSIQNTPQHNSTTNTSRHAIKDEQTFLNVLANSYESSEAEKKESAISSIAFSNAFFDELESTDLNKSKALTSLLKTLRRNMEIFLNGQMREFVQYRVNFGNKSFLVCTLDFNILGINYRILYTIVGKYFCALHIYNARGRILTTSNEEFTSFINSHPALREQI